MVKVDRTYAIEGYRPSSLKRYSRPGKENMDSQNMEIRYKSAEERQEEKI